MKGIIFGILLSANHAMATPAERKLNFYNFNKAHETRIQAVGVDMGSGEITGG